MRIAFVAVKGLPIGGGIEKLTEEIGSRLVERGHAVVVYSSRDYGTADGWYKGMRIKTVPSLNTRSMHKMSICFRAVQDVLRDGTFDLVHVHAIGPSVVALAPRLRGIPTVVQTHGLEWKRDKWGPAGKFFFRLAEFSALYFPHRTTAVSLTQQDYFRNKFGREVTYIPTGVNRVALRAPDWIVGQELAPRRYILFAARLVEEKGAHFLIEAFRSLESDMKLVVAGDATHAEKYKATLRRLADDDPRIIFPGFVTGSALEELFSNAYLFCLPSTLEGLPIALLEAMSYGNCCVASDIPENLEALETYGYTFKNRDSRDLARLLHKLINNPSLVEEKKEAARRHVLENYSWDKVAAQMEVFYRATIDQVRSAS